MTSLTWADACAYAESVIDDECARQGITRRITDPSILATSVNLLRIGRRNWLAQKAAESPAARDAQSPEWRTRPHARPASRT